MASPNSKMYGSVGRMRTTAYKHMRTNPNIRDPFFEVSIDDEDTIGAWFTVTIPGLVIIRFPGLVC